MTSTPALRVPHLYEGGLATVELDDLLGFHEVRRVALGVDACA